MIKKHALMDVLLISIVGLLLFTLFAGSYQLISPDEGRYIEIAREMIASGNYLTPHLDGTVFLDKPIFFYWIEAGLIKVFGLHEWSVRLLPALFAWLGCLFTYFAGRSLYSRRAGLFAAFIQMSMLLYFMSAHYCNMDLMVAVLISGALYLFLVGMQQERRVVRQSYLLPAYFLAALAFLTKGLMGLVFPMMIIGVWILVQRRWRVIKQMCLISGLLLFLVVILPWLFLVQQANHEFLYYFFGVQQFSRYLTADFNVHQPFYFYVPIILLGCFPWVLFLFQALVFNIKQAMNQQKESGIALFLLLWPLLIFLFFSVPESKIVGYILPVFPPLALLIAAYFDAKGERLFKGRSLKVCGFIFLGFAAILSLAMLIVSSMHTITTSGSFIYLSFMALVIMLGGVFTVGAAFYGKGFKSFFILLLATIMIFEVAGVASVKTFVWADKHAVIKHFAYKIKDELKPGDKVIVYNHYFQDLPVYLQRRVYVVADWNAPDLAERDNWRRELAEGILYKHHYRQPMLLNNQQMIKLWDSKQGRVFVLTSSHHANEFKQAVKDKAYLLRSKDKVFLFSNQPNQKAS